MNAFFYHSKRGINFAKIRGFKVTDYRCDALRAFVARMRAVSEFELAFYLFGGPGGDLYFIGTLSQTLSLRAAFRPFRICCRKYPDPAGRLTTTFSPAGEILFHPETLL